MENNEKRVHGKAMNAKLPIYKKWWLCVIIAVVAISVISCASGAGNNVDDQGNGALSGSQSAQNNLGDYNVTVKSCRLAKDYQGKGVVIVKYEFTNNSDDKAAFWTTFEDNVYQDGIGLNECIVTDSSANYSTDNQMKEIKPGATLEVEIAYTLNDSTTPIEVEVSEYFSFDDKVVKKTFDIAP